VKILFIGDIFGSPGIRTLKSVLGDLKKRLGADLVIANGENAAGGFGITCSVARELFAAGVDVLTMGNHVWDKREMLEKIGGFPRLVRPYNLPPETPGNGWCVAEAAGDRVAVLNLVGRVFMDPADCPFRAADEALAEIAAQVDTNFVFVDFHAEATSEKLALGYYLDGRVTALVGTHTHVPTADAMVLPRATGYLTDAGMTGARDSVIGLDRDRIVRRFVTGLPATSVAAEGRGLLMGVLVEADAQGRCTAIRRIDAQEIG
jgi:metallophosphoesterase (TIGR00282 family)